MQQLGRLDGSGAQQHLATHLEAGQAGIAAYLHGTGAALAEFDALHVGAGHYRQVRSCAHRVEEGFGRTETLALPGGLRLVAKAPLADRVDMIGVIGACHAKLAGSADDRIAQRIARRVHGDLEWATHTAPLAFAQLVIFQGDELPAHVFPAPARAALCFPVVVVGWCAPHIDHAVD
ncbi:hypothetical protein D3C73_1010760 [compost metagenome]